MVVAFADHEDIADLQGCANLVDLWLPCRLLQRSILAQPNSCMYLSSAQMLDRLIIQHPIVTIPLLPDFGGVKLTETCVEHSQNTSIGKDQFDDVFWNLIMNDFNERTQAAPRTKNIMTGKWIRINGDCQRFNAIYKHLTHKTGEMRLAISRMQRPVIWSDVDYKRKCDDAEAAYEAKRKKELGMLECRELEFLMIDPSSLPPEKRAIIERKQAKIMRKYPNA
ncbi:hypothetical protein Tco_0892449 [Tanacetum coccineum]|uniref:Uncharacterized protein n=1 Tax=Tanacetum coccineum TaxID=301880 RepID=A0ABQ5C8X5_9ASTR